MYSSALDFVHFLLLCLFTAHNVLGDIKLPSVLPTIQLVTITIPTSFLPAPVSYFWTWEAQTTNAVPYAQFVTSPEGLKPLVEMPPTLPGNAGWNLAGVDQLTSTITMNSNNFGILASVDEDTRELADCQMDLNNATVILSKLGGGTETVSALVQCSTPFHP